MHKPSKLYIVPNALSWLASLVLAPKELELDFASAYNYTATLVEMLDKFKAKLLEGYNSNSNYQRLIEVLEKNNANEAEDSASLPFSRDDNGLLWHHDDTARLCIPDNLIAEVLKIAHTEAGHPGAARTFERAASSWYIRHLSRHVRKFLRHCPQCRVFQTPRHAPFGSL